MNKQSPVKFLVCFVRKQKEAKANEVLNNMGASVCFTTPARGIGPSELLSVMGLDLNESSVIISVVKTEDAHKILAKLCRIVELYKEDLGVAFTIPINAISRDALNGLLEMAKQTIQLNEELNRKAEQKVEQNVVKEEQKEEKKEDIKTEEKVEQKAMEQAENKEEAK